MSEKSTFEISQDFEIIQPKKGKVYPILTQEWIFIKDKIKKIKIDINYYHTFGSILIGSALSIVSTIIATEFKDPNTKNFCWIFFIFTTLSGIMAFIFGEKIRKNNNTNSTEIINHMELIENRFEKSE